MTYRWQQRVRGAALGMALALAALSPTASARAAVTYLVDDNGVECPTATHTDANSSGTPLQKAVDDAIAANVHTIQVCAGAYQNFEMYDYLGGLKIVAQDPDNRPHIVAPSTTNNGTIVRVVGSKNVVLDGLYIDGGPFQDTAGGEMTGVAFQDSTGTIQNSVIYYIRATSMADANGYALSLEDTDGATMPTVVGVKNNVISAYADQGIHISGPVKATITGNQIDGVNGDTSTLPLYGISVQPSNAGMPTGSISKNLISFTQEGVYLGDVSNFKITSNVFKWNTLFGVGIGSQCTRIINGKGTGSNKNLISGNTFIKTPVGVSIWATANGSYPSQCDPHADQNTISKNVMLADQMSGWRTMVQLSASISGVTTFSPVINKTKITGNTGYGFTDVVDINDLTKITNTTDKSNKAVHP